MTKVPADLSGEERLIARYFRPLAKHPGAFGLVDDAAALVPPAGCDIVLKTDGLIGGVHFFPDDPADAVAKKALRVNLSDLAAKGARPLGFLLAIALAAGDWSSVARVICAWPWRRCRLFRLSPTRRRH
jgi:thiamine-monophosphate kinase